MSDVIELRDGSTTGDRRLDRLTQFDERSRSYTIDKVLVERKLALDFRESSLPAPIRRSWRLDRSKYLDQLSYGACVSTAIGHDLAAVPVAVGGVTFDSVRDCIYFVAQRGDQWAGGEYPGADPRMGGTSVLEGLKAGRALGCFESFSWAFSIDEALRGLCHVGPLVIGIGWPWAAMKARPSGLLDMSGSDAGGHAVAVTEFYPNLHLPGEGVLGPCVGIPQSWGLDYGHRGRCYMKVEDLERKLLDDGEAAMVTGRRPVRWRGVCGAATA